MGIYMDNAATTMQKPDCVIDAVVNAMRHMGNSGRGAHEASLDASRLIYETREMLSELFNLGDPRQVAFTLNSTEALNTAILGLFDPGDHIISTVMEHNSVLRPLYRLEEKGCQGSFVPCDEKGRLRTDLLESFLKENTKALVCTHASNLTGNANDLMYLGRFCKDHGLLFVVDASQTAGVLPIDMQAMNIDVVCFTGHKGLYGPQGTGLLLCGQTPPPLLEGGTGSESIRQEMPDFLPDRLEAGTHNIAGIAGLLEGLRFVEKQGVQSIGSHERALTVQMGESLAQLPGVEVFRSKDPSQQAGVLSFRVSGMDCEELGEALGRRDIALRSGLHCAPLAHRTAGTLETGTVRASVSAFNVPQEIPRFVRELRQILSEKP